MTIDDTTRFFEKLDPNLFWLWLLWSAMLLIHIWQEVYKFLIFNLSVWCSPEKATFLCRRLWKFFPKVIFGTILIGSAPIKYILTPLLADSSVLYFFFNVRISRNLFHKCSIICDQLRIIALTFAVTLV